MFMTLIALDWKKWPAEPELQQIIRHAALSLAKNEVGSKVCFEHPQACGVITRRKAGTIGIFSGPQFQAEYSRPDSSLEFELTFLIPRGSLGIDTILADPGSVITTIRTSDNGPEVIGQFDPSELSAPVVHRPN